jgi:4-hydroxy-tetrahydrodipicolinate synthase
MNDFRVHVALTTPFREDGRVDLEALRAHVVMLSDDGVDGVVPAGTTGEGPLLEEAEVASVIATTVRAAAGRMEVIAHVGRASTPGTVRLAKAAMAAGADAVIAITPYYYEHGPGALLSHYRTLMEAVVPSRVFAYTFPARAGYALPAEVLDTLAGEGLAGLKDSTQSAERYDEYLEVGRAHEGLRVFSGWESLTLRALRAGGAGSITALANARADVLLRVRDERSEEAQKAVDDAVAEMPAIPAVKRGVAARLAELGVSYPLASRAPIGA